MGETMTTPTPEQSKELTRFYQEWRKSLDRLEMARSSLEGALNESTLKQARFLGAAEFVYGTTDVAYEYTAETGLVFKQPNREARRATAKAKRRIGKAT